MVRLTPKEMTAIVKYLKVCGENAQAFNVRQGKPDDGFGIPDPNTITVERKSETEYDVIVRYKDKSGMGVGALLYLGSIREMTHWTKPFIANRTDHPDMAMDGDWSGVRDTSEDKLLAIFREYCL